MQWRSFRPAISGFAQCKARVPPRGLLIEGEGKWSAPEKWSFMKYGFVSLKEDEIGRQETDIRRDRGQASAGPVGSKKV
jgi:hypothetical protein